MLEATNCPNYSCASAALTSFGYKGYKTGIKHDKLSVDSDVKYFDYNTHKKSMSELLHVFLCLLLPSGGHTKKCRISTPCTNAE